MPDFDTSEFRRALGIFATGVTIVTARDVAGSAVGLTVNSFNSVSLEPPLVLWSLGKTSKSLHVFEHAGHFAVHLLAANQQSLSERFATRGIDKFSGIDVSAGIDEIPLLSGCAARFQCRTALKYDAGDHVIFVGEVKQFDSSSVPPLVFLGGAYAVATRRPQSVPWEAVWREREFSYSADSIHYLVGLLDLQLSYHVAPTICALGFEDLREFQLLMILGLAKDRTLEQINSNIPSSGAHFTQAMCRRLVRSGFVELARAGLMRLTEQGEAVLTRGRALAKAKEAEALGYLDESEQLALRHLLKRLILRTDVGAGSDPQSVPRASQR